MTTPTPSNSPSRIDALRWLASLVAIVTLGVWGFNAFEFPFPALLTGIGTPLLALVLWALFLSPRPVFVLDVFGVALVEIVLATTAAFAMLELRWPWWIALTLVVLATAAGVIAGRRKLG